jgi:hypothetical protein
VTSPIRAIVERGFRTETRAARGHMLRLTLALLLLLMLAGIQQSLRFGAGGLSLLNMVVWPSFVFITLAGCSYFSSVITEEKEEQNMGLLLMAGVTGPALILGKSLTRLWESALLLAVPLPFALLAVTLGGVSVTQVVASIIALITYAIFLSALGMFVSVRCKTSRTAAGLMTWILGGILLVPGFFGAAFAGSGNIWLNSLGRGLTVIYENTINYRIIQIMSLGQSGGVWGSQITVTLVASAALFVLASLMFERYAQDTGDIAPARLVAGGRSRWRLFGMPRPKPGLRALAWKDFHFICGGRLMLMLKPILLIGAISVIFLLNRRTVNDGIILRDLGNMTIILSLIWITVEVGLHLSRVLAVEVAWQTASSLLTLPYNAATMLYGKMRVAAVSLTPILVILGLGILMSPKDFFDILDKSSGEKGHYLLWLFVLNVVFFWQACAYLSLKLKRGAFAAALGLAFGLQFLGLLFFNTIFRLSDEDTYINGDMIILSVLTLLMHIKMRWLWAASAEK